MRSDGISGSTKSLEGPAAFWSKGEVWVKPECRQRPYLSTALRNPCAASAGTVTDRPLASSSVLSSPN